MPYWSWIVWIMFKSSSVIDVTRAYVDEPIVVAAINNSDGFTTLSNVEDIAITTIGSSTYALAISNVGDRHSGVQIIDITDPSDPTAVSVVRHSEEYRYLIHPNSIDTITVDSRTYALVTSSAAPDQLQYTCTVQQSPTHLNPKYHLYG